MVDSQSHSSSNQTRALGAGDEEEEEEEAEAPKLVSTSSGRPEVNSYPEANICTPKKSSSRSLTSCLQWRKRPLLIFQLLPSTLVHFLPLPL